MQTHTQTHVQNIYIYKISCKFVFILCGVVKNEKLTIFVFLVLFVVYNYHIYRLYYINFMKYEVKNK